MIALWPFYFVTMEQYYTGEMNFPPINGVDEGSLVITGLSFISAYYGNVEFWTQQIDVPGMGKTQLNQGVTYIIILVIYAYGLSGLVNIYYGRHLAGSFQSDLQAPPNFSLLKCSSTSSTFTPGQ